MIAAAPVNASAESYLTYIEHIPPEDGPQMFGMHASVSGIRTYFVDRMGRRHRRVLIIEETPLICVDQGTCGGGTVLDPAD